jgi:hypothetical protein
MKPRHLALTRLALALLPVLHAGHAQTATVTWLGPDLGDWNTRANWTGNALPTAVDDVQLGSFNTQIRSDAAAASVTGTGVLNLLDSLPLTGNSSQGALLIPGGKFNSSASTAISGPLPGLSANIVSAGTTRVEGATTLDLTRGRSNLELGHTLVLNGTTRAGTGTGITSPSKGGFGIVAARLLNGGTWLDQAAANTSFTNVIAPLGLGYFDNVVWPQ